MCWALLVLDPCWYPWHHQAASVPSSNPPSEAFSGSGLFDWGTANAMQLRIMCKMSMVCQGLSQG
jgi:hypothetical protein